MTQYTVKYDLTEKEEAALRELLPNYQQYISAGGSRPFEKYTLADVFQSLMYIILVNKGAKMVRYTNKPETAFRFRFLKVYSEK